MGVIIQQYKIEEILALRHQELRKGKPLESAKMPGDEDALHYGLSVEDSLVSIASIFKSICPVLLSSENQVQLRGMATNEKYKGKGLGKVLLSFIEADVKLKGYELVWCNARTSAKEFYAKCGWKNVSDELFEIEGIGTHIRMFKALV
jgi:GNAT superfamily N-acetyltransferase